MHKLSYFIAIYYLCNLYAEVAVEINAHTVEITKLGTGSLWR
jgi:hypothetical protein